MDFNEALNIKAEDIKRPPLLPVGTYTAIVSKVPEISLSEDQRYQFVDFPLKIIKAEEDVDHDELRNFGGLNGQVRRHRFLFNRGSSSEDESAFNRTLYQIKRFLVDHLQVEPSELKQMIDSSVNHQCLISIGRRMDKVDPEIQYEDIKRTAPV